MKKYFFLFLLSLVLVGCSSDGSREIQIDEVKFVPKWPHNTIEECKNVCSVFEVVPGKYEIAWNLIDDLPQRQNYDISLKLKLRLKRTVKVKPELIDEVANSDDFNFSTPCEFYLLDANGKKYKGFQGFNLAHNSIVETRRSEAFSNKDHVMDFLRFLQSKPGTEIELVMYTIGVKSGVVNEIENCKNAKGIVCGVDRDSNFEFAIGTIE